MNLEVLPDVIGMIGVSLVLSAFGLLNMNKVTSSTMMYQLMNLLGSMLLLFSLCFHLNIASVVIEIAWMLISLVGIYRALKKKRSESIGSTSDLIIQAVKSV
jgi:hypothetical protein